MYGDYDLFRYGYYKLLKSNAIILLLVLILNTFIK